MKPHPLLPILAFFLMAPVWAQPACPLPDGALSLAQVVDLALCNNPSTRVARANVAGQEAQVDIAGGAYWPTVSANLGANRQYAGGSARDDTRSNQYSAGASVNYLLYDGGARDAKEEAARRTLDAVLATQETTAQTVLLSAVSSFYQLQGAQAAQLSATTSEAQARQNLQAADARYQAGSATPLDRLQAQTAVSQAVLTRINTEGEVRNQQAALAQAMGLPATTMVQLAPAQVNEAESAPAVQALIDQALSQRPDLKAAQARVAAARANVEQVRANDSPTVSLSANQNLARSQPGSNTHSTSFGVQLSIPIFSGFIPRNQSRVAQASLAAVEAERDRLMLTISQEVVRASNTVQTISQSWCASRDLLLAAERAQEVAKKRYEAGAGSYLDLQSAQTQLDGARAQEIQSRFNWQIARFTLAQAIGALNQQSVEQEK